MWLAGGVQSLPPIFKGIAMQPSPALIHFVTQKDMESFSPVAYDDGGGVWTIGFGHTLGVKQGDTCTMEQAQAWLQQDMQPVFEAVSAKLLNPSQNEFDAFCSLTFNIGVSAFKYHCSALTSFNNGDKNLAAKQFLLWNKGTQHGVFGVVTGLWKRRMCEAIILLGQPWQISNFALESNPNLNAATLTRCLENYA
jgi:lysozyme